MYLLYGEESYLKKQYKNRLTQAILPPDDTVNYAYYEGKGIPVAEVIDLAETMPFFSERRLVVVENSGFFKHGEAELAEYVKQLPDTAYFIFVESEIDKRGKMYKAVKDKGRAVELLRQDEKTLLLWLSSFVKREQRQVQESTLRYLVAKTGTDMENLEKEMEKLLCYTIGRTELTVLDIDEICTTQISNKIFEMIEAVAGKRQKAALDYYYDLLALKEPPMRILFLLSRQFKLLLEVKTMSKQGADKKTIAQETGLHPFVVGKYIDQCRVFSEKVLRGILEEAVDLEESVKTGRLLDTMSVELFIVKYSGA